MCHERGLVPASERGFTLVEMMLVTLLIAIVAGSAVVNLKDRQDAYALRAAGRDLAAAVRLAATQAGLEGAPYRLTWGDAMEAYRVEVMRAGQSEFTPAEGLAGVPRRMMKGVSVSAIQREEELMEMGMESLVFEPDGNGFSGAIELRSRGGQTMSIRVMPWTGQVLVEEGK